MAKLRRVSRKPIYTILLASLLISIVYTGIKYIQQPQPIQVMEISPTPLEFGHTTVSGKLIKDTPVNQKGSYLLTLSDMRLIYLTSENIDSLVGQTVSVTGTLVPSDEQAKPMIMVVEEIHSL
jgi:hypothetical protein